MPKGSAAPPLIYVDSCVYLDLVTKNRDLHAEDHDERWKSAKALFDAVNENAVLLASSPLVEAEVCCNGESRTDKKRINDLLAGWFTSRSTLWVEIDRHMAREAIRLIDAWQGKGEAGKKMSAADALHLAASVRLGAEYLMTHDGGFPIGKRVEGVLITRPQVVWQESLLNHASGE